MKILIQDVKTGHYLVEQGKWATEAVTARDFRYSAYTQAVIRREKIRGAKVMFYFEDFDYQMKAVKAGSERLYRRLGAAAVAF